MKINIKMNYNNNANDLLSALLLFIVGVMITSILIGLPTMLLWNWLMPTIFGLSKITFWQAFGLSIFCKMLLSPTINYNQPKDPKDSKNSRN